MHKACTIHAHGVQRQPADRVPAPRVERIGCALLVVRPIGPPLACEAVSLIKADGAVVLLEDPELQMRVSGFRFAEEFRAKRLADMVRQQI